MADVGDAQDREQLAYHAIDVQPTGNRSSVKAVVGHGYRLRAAAIRGDVLLPCFYVGTPTSNSVRTRRGTRGLCRLLHRPGGLVRARRRWACRGPVALATKMPANAGRRGDLAPTHELTCASEHWRLHHPAWSGGVTVNHKRKASVREQHRVHALLGRLLARHVPAGCRGRRPIGTGRRRLERSRARRPGRPIGVG